MYNFNLKKLILQRKLRSSRGKFPVYNFFQQYNLIEKLYWEIEKNVESTQLIFQARRQLVISLVGAVEVYFKDSIKDIIDNTDTDNFLLLSLFRNRFNLMDISNVIEHRISMGEIISSLCSFQGLVTVDKTFSKLLGGADFFYNLNNFEFDIEDENTNTNIKTTILKEDKNVYIILKEMFLLRQNLTHDHSHRLSITETQIQNFLSATSLFALATNEYFKKMFYTNKKDERRQKIHRENDDNQMENFEEEETDLSDE